MTKAIVFEESVPDLMGVARRVGTDPDAGVSVGWLLMERARRRGRLVQVNWLLVGVRRVLLREVRSVGTVRLDAEIDAGGRPLHEVIPALEVEIEGWRCIELDPFTEAIVANLNTADMAKEHSITRRSAQYLLARQCLHFEQGDFFLGVTK